MQLSIIIVSWNTRELTLKCLKSIFKHLTSTCHPRESEDLTVLKQDISFDVYLIDNNSTDGTVEAVRNFVAPSFSSDESGLKAGVTDKLHIIENKENVGFARANNQAILLCHPRTSDNLVEKNKNQYILLLNPDTELIDDSLLQMIEFAKNNSDVGIVGPKLLNTDLSLQKSCRQFPSLLDQLLIQLKFYNFWSDKFKAIRKYFMLDFDYEKSREVDQVMGAAMLIKKEVIEKIGLFDEKFWAIFEEVDFCKRAQDAGFKIYFFANTKIIHHKEQSFGQWKKMKKQINFNRSLYHYFYKHKKYWQLFILWLVQPINLFLTIVDVVMGVRRFFGKSKDL